MLKNNPKENLQKTCSKDLLIPEDKDDPYSSCSSGGFCNEDIEKDQLPTVPLETEPGFSYQREEVIISLKELNRVLPETPGNQGASGYLLEHSFHFPEPQIAYSHSTVSNKKQNHHTSEKPIIPVKRSYSGNKGFFPIRKTKNSCRGTNINI